MLNNFFVENYKNLIMEKPLPLGKLNIFIGPNGSGKSNLFEAVHFLPDCLEHGMQKEIRSRLKGLDSILNKNLSVPNKISFKWGFKSVPMVVAKVPVRYILDIDISSYSYYAIEREILEETKPRIGGQTHIKRHLDFSYSRGEVNIDVDISPSKEAVKKNVAEDFEVIPEGELALRKLSSPIQYPGVEYIKNKVSLWRFYNANHISIKNIRDKPSEIDPSTIYIDETGENLAIVLYNLMSKEDSDFGDELYRLLGALCENFKDLKFPIIDSQHLEMRWKNNDVKRQLTLHGLSDGTIRMLCWAAILCHPNPSPLICIDEPEIGLHPEWIYILADLIKEAVERGKTQILLATHSPDLLDCFTEYAANVIVTETDDTRNAVFKKLDTDELKPWLKRYRLGEMYRKREPIIGGWSY
ncbi:AAA family ATPase [Candidatus Magnetominusculus xianensis]|uniref:ATPase n=1 Tax=Candidatus Magnetominusculus xianensis TaxID=1748249 RepID=A0ABR5SIM9_9BACT|nr:AAA family ATPase [Candidatus Magnetominusculus xianensis]KWT92774.1 ATPase [Candidatus Magnetominusculus xianensis]MBF0405228.1 AAA family ATPase [Nitrospirota bacterium]